MEELEIVPKKEKKQHIWVEKYRPNKLEDYLGNALIKETFSLYVKNQDFPHILLCGGPGTGKTTLAKMLTKSVDCEFIYINASDERTIDTVRDKIKNFVSSAGFKPLKAIILDEFDGMPELSQRTLRSVMETYALRNRFILTANYKERIIEAIESRCQKLELISPTKKEVALHLIKILQQENVEFRNEDLAEIITSQWPDIRKIIQVCQQSSLTGTLKLSQQALISQNTKNRILDLLIKKSSFQEIRKFVVEQDLKKFEEIYEYLYENLDKFAEGKQASVILKLADGQRDDILSVNKQISFLATIIGILQALKV
jgi:DNA polymerase III delta prime subunit